MKMLLNEQVRNLARRLAALPFAGVIVAGMAAVAFAALPMDEHCRPSYLFVPTGACYIDINGDGKCKPDHRFDLFGTSRACTDRWDVAADGICETGYEWCMLIEDATSYTEEFHDRDCITTTDPDTGEIISCTCTENITDSREKIVDECYYG